MGGDIDVRKHDQDAEEKLFEDALVEDSEGNEAGSRTIVLTKWSDEKAQHQFLMMNYLTRSNFSILMPRLTQHIRLMLNCWKICLHLTQQ